MSDQDPPPDDLFVPPETPEKGKAPAKTPSTPKKTRGGRRRGHSARKEPTTPRTGTSSAPTTPGATDTDPEAADDGDAQDGSLDDDNDNDDDLGAFAALMAQPPEGWTKETRPKIPTRPPRTNVTRFAPRTKITFGFALVFYYDDSTRYALRWHNAGMTHPIPGQRNGQSPGPSKGGKIDMEVLKTWMVFHFSINDYWNHERFEARLALSNVRLTDQGVFYALCTMTPQRRGARFQADFDQHGDVRTSRIPLDPPMIIWANGIPWFTVYKGFYVLCGSWNTATYLVGTKYRSSVTEFHLGGAVAPPDAVAASRMDTLTQLTLRAFDSKFYPDAGQDGPVDLIHIGTLSRGQNKIACRFVMRSDPASYTLVYTSKLKKGLGSAFLFDLPNYHERICSPSDDFPEGSFADPVPDTMHTIPQHAFADYPFTYGKDFPSQEAAAVKPQVLELVDWNRMYGLIDACVADSKGRARKRARREAQRAKTLSEVDSRPPWSRVRIPTPCSRDYGNTDLRYLISRISHDTFEVAGPVKDLLFAVEALYQVLPQDSWTWSIATQDHAGLITTRALMDNGDPQTINMLRKGMSDHDIMRDAMAFAEGMLLLEQCLKTLEDSDLKTAVQGIVNLLQPPPQTPLHTVTFPPFFG
ncbi:hypothetical protein PENSUB_5978 [Penicillium subrubescens]|uniref:Uncharacterized protein n=1 Tax=Penicillium subrubescens TaxID=1316194 RepID=A0A1Q5U4I5_9EURO|nr:hypothetical protein PENSUB_5978 [Penicillium subrubescens]